MITSSEFFDSTGELKSIEEWAHARFAAKWAVFLAVLLRVSASTSPGVQLPGIIGGPASLNLIGAFVSPSGGGKGVSDKVAKLAWPTPIIERPVGSGEGIAALFAPPKKEGAEQITQAIINVSEIDSLAGIAGRQGSILLAQLKAAVMGELIGQSNASEATTRVALPHTYRMCMSIGAQPGHCDVIFRDTSGGTPQRVLWAPTIDPDMPGDVRADPQPLNTRLPLWAHQGTEIIYGHSEIRDQIVSAHLARQRGEPDALDGHRMLAKCKVAAVLAIMHHRSVVGELDWALAETVMSVSDNTRDWIVAEARKADRAKVRDRAVARAAGEDFYDASRLETVKRSLLRMLERDGEQAGNKLRSRLGKREKRDLFDQAVDLLEAEGLIAERTDEYNGAKRVRYRIGSGLTNEVTPQNRTTEGMTPKVRPDLDATVTNLDTRRSIDHEAPRLSTAKWLTQHLQTLRDEGHQTVTAVAVYDAGEVAGYKRSTIATVASTHPDITVVDKTGGRSTWSITGEHTPYVTAAEWVDKYIDRLPAVATEVDQTALRHAAVAANYTWDAVRHAALLGGRIDSRPAHGTAKSERIWQIVPTGRTEDAS